MLFTELGIVREMRPEQPEKANPSILFTELGIIVLQHPTINVFVSVSIIALQLSRLSYFVFPDSTTKEVRPEHI